MAQHKTHKMVLVGGTGFIGQAVGRALAARGVEILVTTRDPSQWVGQMAFPCQLVRWDPQHEEFPIDLDSSIQAVINLAGANIGDHRWTKTYKSMIRDSRITTTQKIVSKLKTKQHPLHQPQPRLVQASAVGYYGSQHDHPLDEQSPKGQGFLADLCAEWEEEALKAEKAGCSVSILRIGVVLGWGGGFLKTLSPLYLKGLGASIGKGTQWMPWIHMLDLVNIMTEAAFGNLTHQRINATAPEPVTFKSLHGHLTERMGFQISPPVPVWALKGLMGERAEIALASQRVIPAQLLGTDQTDSQSNKKKGSFTFNFPSITAALDNLFASNDDRGSYHLTSEQWVPYKRDDIWPFFSDETNLEKLTPHWLHFKVVGKSTPTLQTGSRIQYQLRLHGIPLKWESEIRMFNPKNLFVDRQNSGPYALWDHTHTFEDLGNGTLISDHVRLRLPLGKLGFAVAGPFVLKDLEKIFRFRRTKIAAMFPTQSRD